MTIRRGPQPPVKRSDGEAHSIEKVSPQRAVSENGTKVIIDETVVELPPKVKEVEQ